MLKILPTIFLAFQLSSAAGPAIYAAVSSHERLAARISCKVDESQRFRYSSETNLWGIAGGDILLTADVTLHCLGVDTGGKYETGALKYLVEVSNLVLEQRNNGKDGGDRSRRDVRDKRDVRDYFSNAWSKIKRFFKKMFGGSSAEPERRPPAPAEGARDSRPDQRKEPSDQEEEDFSSSRLEQMYSAPFLFVQLANGSVPEVRFSDSDTDGRIRNFKRHLVDAFATQLDVNHRRKPVVETTVMGEHVSAYNVTVDRQSAPMVTLAGLAMKEGQTPEGGGSGTVLVEKMVTESDILKLAPGEGNGAINDRDKMALKMQQMQIFKEGKMVASSGTSSLVLLHESQSKESRSRRDTVVDGEEDIMSHFQANSVFDMQLKRRQKRSLEETNRLDRIRETSFTASSRSAEIEDSSLKHSLQALQDSIQNVTLFFKSLMETHDDDYNEKMQLLFEMVEREVSLKLDDESHAVSKTARRVLSKQVMENMCSQNFTKCKDFLQLLALAGGPEAEQVLLSFLKKDYHQLNHSQLSAIADIVSDVSNPSGSFLSSLGTLIRKTSSESPDFFGPLVLSAGHLASTAAEDTKSDVAGSLMYAFDGHRHRCHSDPVVLDILEAMGNLGHSSPVNSVLKVASECQRDEDIQIASAHALRHSTEMPEVQRWMQGAVERKNCELTRAVIGTLMDRINEQEMEREKDSWPLHRFNSLDTMLLHLLQNTTPSTHTPCNEEDILRYFSRKKDSRASDIAREHFARDSGPWDPESGTRHKRALWDNLNCDEWTEDSKYRPIQDREEFAADKANYNKRKSCLAYRRLGVKGANAEIYAGMFAGVKEPSEPPKYKLFTKFVSGLNFLGRNMEIGSFYFYLQGGKTKAYVRILDRTRQEFTHDGCTPTDLRYRPVKHIPLYLVSVSAVQVSLGIHLSSQLALDTECPEGGAYRLEPLASVRVGGEATGTVLLGRGTVNVGGNFNYKMQFTFTPTPNMCLKGSHGYDPMSISFETYYQLWNKAKDDWGKFRSWKPSFLSWQLRRASQKSWFDDTCIIEDAGSSDHRQNPDLEREERK